MNLVGKDCAAASESGGQTGAFLAGNHTGRLRPPQWGLHLGYQ